MTKAQNGTWVVKEVDRATIERLAAGHVSDEMATQLGGGIIGDPKRGDDDGYIWSRLRRSRNVRDVVPGAAVVMGSDIGRYVAKVISWDFEVDDDDPIVTMELVPLSPEALTVALYRNRPSAA